MARYQERFRNNFYALKDGTEISTNLFNKSKNGKVFPPDFKLATIFQVYKGQKKMEKPCTYTGISLLSICDKISSGILVNRLRDWFISRKNLTEFQAGFLKWKWSINDKKDMYIFKFLKKTVILVFCRVWKRFWLGW